MITIEYACTMPSTDYNSHRSQKAVDHSKLWNACAQY